jgi:hypothetical protein
LLLAGTSRLLVLAGKTDIDGILTDLGKKLSMNESKESFEFVKFTFVLRLKGDIKPPTSILFKVCVWSL